MKPKNIPEFIALKKKYESITHHDIENITPYTTMSQYGFIIANALTGFGDNRTCTLCLRVKVDCNECVYSKLNGVFWVGEGCRRDVMEYSYFMIRETHNKECLIKAFKTRAEAMRKYAELFNIKID
jgi:hypothetical protein